MGLPLRRMESVTTRSAPDFSCPEGHEPCDRYTDPVDDVHRHPIPPTTITAARSRSAEVLSGQSYEGNRPHFYPIRERLGLEVRFHDLRHTCVTLLLGLGIPPHIVRDIVGHSALDVTMNIYAHADMTEKRALVKEFVW
ncbi:tyrosine-type recombinase/integrase [Streptomyces sp. NPDC004596]